jgi:glycosyltransferase involved in cell wall biosynthesis
MSWWKYTSRPESLAKALGAENYFFAQGAGLWHFKYIPRAWMCFWTLLRRRPRLVFASNPPPFCPLVVWVYCLLFRARFVIDSHTSAFDRRRWLLFKPLHAFLERRAIFGISTNTALTDRISAMGGRSIAVPDIPFDMPEGSYPVNPDKFALAFVSSFDVDEPTLEVFEAVRDLSDVHVYVTGNPEKASAEIREAKPDNVTFTGFLSNEAYAGLMRSVSAVLVLTTFDFTFQRGGSEAVSVGTPIITSDFPVLREYFNKGTLHVDNSPGQIRAAIETMQRDHSAYEREVLLLQQERKERWETIQETIEAWIAQALA